MFRSESSIDSWFFCFLILWKDWTSFRGFENTRSSAYTPCGTPSCCSLCYWLLDFKVLFRRVYFPYHFYRVWNASKLLFFLRQCIYCHFVLMLQVLIEKLYCCFLWTAEFSAGVLASAKAFHKSSCGCSFCSQCRLHGCKFIIGIVLLNQV